MSNNLSDLVSKVNGKDASGASKKKQVDWYSLLGFDSAEEAYFCWWLDQLFDAGYIKMYAHHPDTYKLSEPVIYHYQDQMKTKLVEKQAKLMEGHVYTPDFVIEWDKGAEGLIYSNIDNLGKKTGNPFFVAKDDRTVIEVKASFDHQNMSRLAVINIKWVFQQYGDYVQMVIPKPGVNKAGKCTPKKTLFTETFVPQRFLWTDSGKQLRKINFPHRTLKEFLDGKAG